MDFWEETPPGIIFSMNRFWTTLPLLFLTVVLTPRHGADAQPGHFSPHPAAADLIAAINNLRESNGLLSYDPHPVLMNIAQTRANSISGTGAPTLIAGTTIPNTPLPGGEIYHIVQKNEALWSIALLYGTTVQELKLLNSLPGDEIFEGQKLLVRRANTETPRPTMELQTATLGIPTSTATQPTTPTITQTPTPLPAPPTSMRSGGAVVGGITLAALLSAGLFAFLGRKKKTYA